MVLPHTTPAPSPAVALPLFASHLYSKDSLPSYSVISLSHHSRVGSTDGWRCMERPLVSMISRMIRAKASIPHEIIRAELAAPPLVVEALTRSVSFMHRTWALPRDRYAHLALESSRQLASQGDRSCWYAQMTSWFELHGFSMDKLPPFQYSLDAPSISFTPGQTLLGLSGRT